MCISDTSTQNIGKFWIALVIALADLSAPTTLIGQVVNDNIVNRSLLLLDSAATSSSTDMATVEWRCIDKKLTEKCVIYHNDQWFTFKVDVSGTYYLNISSQKCRDAKGIQAIVIEGNPCEAATYKILKCIPQIVQQDVFIELVEVKAGVRYLINIDGFLGDFCNFNIQLSSHPEGLNQHAISLDTLHLQSSIDINVVTLRWTLPQTYTDSIDLFQIYRRVKKAVPYELDGIVPAEFNTLGVAQTYYEFVDTLSSEGTYSYQITGLMKNGIIEIMDEHVVSFYRKSGTYRQTLDLLLDFREGTHIQMDLIDKNEDKILRHSAFQFRKSQDRNQKIFVGNYIERGINNFIVRITSGKTPNVKDHEFVVMQDGSIIKL